MTAERQAPGSGRAGCPDHNGRPLDRNPPAPRAERLAIAPNRTPPGGTAVHRIADSALGLLFDSSP